MKAHAGSPPSAHLCLVFTHSISARHLAEGQLAFLRRQGLRVTVISSPGHDLEIVAKREQVDTRAVAMAREIQPHRDLQSLWQLTGALRSLRPDIVSAGTPKAGLLGMLAARWCGIPIRVYTQRGLRLETTTGWRRTLLSGTERLAAACAHRVVCVSPSLRQRYLDLGLTAEAKTVVLGDGSSNGVDPERFTPRPSDPEESQRLRRELGIAPDRRIIGFIGRFTRDKGTVDLARAFDLVRERFSRACLLMVGFFDRGDAAPSSLVERLMTDDDVIVHKFVEDTAPYYRLMDLLAFPSYREGFPNAPLEAAAMQVPVAGYAATGTVDAVKDGVTGRLVPVGDWRALAEAMSGYLADPSLGERHGRAGRERVMARFRRETVWQAWYDLYRGLIEEKFG